MANCPQCNKALLTNTGHQVKSGKLMSRAWCPKGCVDSGWVAGDATAAEAALPAAKPKAATKATE